MEVILYSAQSQAQAAVVVTDCPHLLPQQMEQMVVLVAAETALVREAEEMAIHLRSVRLKVATAVLVLHPHRITAEAEVEVLVL
jgi:ribosomal protein S10